MYFRYLALCVFMRLVHITIKGRPGVSVDYQDGSNTEAVKKDLMMGFGPGTLKRNNVAVTTDTVSGNYEFHPRCN